jgi:hypothetical protein
MGVRTSLIATALAASHTSVAFKAHRNAAELVTQAEQQKAPRGCRAGRKGSFCHGCGRLSWQRRH